jgi:hypothetical protein
LDTLSVRSVFTVWTLRAGRFFATWTLGARRLFAPRTLGPPRLFAPRSFDLMPSLWGTWRALHLHTITSERCRLIAIIDPTPAVARVPVVVHVINGAALIVITGGDVDIDRRARHVHVGGLCICLGITTGRECDQRRHTQRAREQAKARYWGHVHPLSKRRAARYAPALAGQ